MEAPSPTKSYLRRSPASSRSFAFSSEYEDYAITTEDKSSVITSQEQAEDDMMLFSNRNKPLNQSKLHHNMKQMRQWSIVNISSNIKGVEIYFSLEVKTLDGRTLKEIRNDVMLVLKLDEENIQNRIERFSIKNNIATSDWQRLSNYIHLKFNDFVIYHLVEGYMKNIQDLNLPNIMRGSYKIDREDLSTNRHDIEERIEYECRKIRYDIHNNFAYDENLIYDKSNIYETLKKNLLQALESKRKNLLLQVDKLQV